MTYLLISAAFLLGYLLGACVNVGRGNVNPRCASCGSPYVRMDDGLVCGACWLAEQARRR